MAFALPDAWRRSARAAPVARVADTHLVLNAYPLAEIAGLCVHRYGEAPALVQNGQPVVPQADEHAKAVQAQKIGLEEAHMSAVARERALAAVLRGQLACPASVFSPSVGPWLQMDSSLLVGVSI